jgi:hypothetical protein
VKGFRGLTVKTSRPKSKDHSRLPLYRERFAQVEGWFTAEAQAIWDFLFVMQSKMSVTGGFMEVGVWKGKSAFLGALHLMPNEAVILVDVSSAAAVADEIRKYHPGEVVVYTGRSSLVRSSKVYAKHRGTIRFFHVDGEHSCFGAFGDILLASEMVGARALISIDDFGNMRYPQLHAAVYKFLFARPDFKMVLCGANKAYLCRTEDFALFDGLIRNYLVPYVTSLGCPLSLARTSYAHDYGCFAVQDAVDGHSLVGRDEDPDDVVF